MAAHRTITPMAAGSVRSALRICAVVIEGASRGIGDIWSDDGRDTVLAATGLSDTIPSDTSCCDRTHPVATCRDSGDPATESRDAPGSDFCCTGFLTSEIISFYPAVLFCAIILRQLFCRGGGRGARHIFDHVAAEGLFEPLGNGARHVCERVSRKF